MIGRIVAIQRRRPVLAMVQLSNERIQQILKEETTKAEETTTILRAIYIRYMRLYEKYFADIDALNNEEIEALRKDHEETKSLIKYYYMDIPQDICDGIKEFEKQYSENLLGSEWRVFLHRAYEDFKDQCEEKRKSEEYYKAAFSKQTLSYFYDAMDYIFRQGFGTESETRKNMVTGIKGLLFGKEK